MKRELANREPEAGSRVSTRGRAFTLIELLVVIAVIAILAALIFPVTGAVNRAKIRNRTRGELEKVATAIEIYKNKLGHYPPDNPARPEFNQLYYELVGTTLENNRVYAALDGSSQLNSSVVNGLFGVSGFVNSSRGGGGDEGGNAVNFFPKGGLKAGQFLAIGNPPNSPVLLGTPVDGPILFTNTATKTMINPWRYNSSSPTNNYKTFDLWIDVFIGNKTNRIANWSEQVLTP